MIETLRQYIKYFICSKPRLYRWWIVFGDSRKKKLAASKSVEIVIEGYPRSANTYAVVAFRQAGNTNVRVAHHTHVPATVLFGCQNSIPTVVLIRKPLDAIVSARIFTQKSPRILIQEWIWFYQACWPVRDKFSVAMFEDVISDYSSIIENINKTYGTTFCNNLSGDYSSSICSEIDAIANQHGHGVDQVARPTKKREQIKAEVIRDIMRESELLHIADKIYEKYRSIASVDQIIVDQENIPQ